MTPARLMAALFAALAVALGLVAWASPRPDHVTDRGIYEATEAQVIVPDCSDLQCFRVLVPWTLGRLPGPSIAKWKAYATLSNAAAAVFVLALCLTLGLSRRSAGMAAAISAFGFGSLYTLYDPHTSDPLMFALGPAITNALLLGRIGVAAAVGVVGVFAKEFAAAPLYAFAAYSALERRWLPAARALAAGNAAFIVWALLTIGLMLRFNYTYGWNGNGSANFAEGAALALWLQKQSARGVASAMFNEFGALYLLAPAGFLFAPRQLQRLILVSLPIAAVFGFVQQPDRGLWNFHYLVAPLAALVLVRVPAPLAWTTIGLFAFGNLRVGAQLPIAGVARWAIAGSVVLAAISTISAWRQSEADRTHLDRGVTPAFR
jgi:hypothetical protein